MAQATMPARRPLIGVTGRRLPGHVLTPAVGFRDAPVEAYFGEYAAQICRAGGLPVNLPFGVPGAEVAELLDGVVLSGGGDVDPALYRGVEPAADVDPIRDEYELDLLAAIIDLGKPVLGICRGAQLINVARGGTLVADLPADVGEAHSSYAFARERRRHSVALQPGSLGHRLYGDKVWVNSFHHQAVDHPGEGLVVTGRAPDGVAEVIELPGRPVLGVQWHPESLDDDPAFPWLVQNARIPRIHQQDEEAIA